MFRCYECKADMVDPCEHLRAAGVRSQSKGLMSDLPSGVRKQGTEYARHGISLWRHMKRDPRFKDWDDESLVMAITMVAWETGFKAALKAMLREFPATPLEKCRGTYPQAVNADDKAKDTSP